MKSDERKTQLNGMRDMLWFLEQNPDVDLPNFTFVTWVWNKADVVQAARLMRPVKKSVQHGTFALTREFAPGVSLATKTYQSYVCESRVVDKKWIDEEPAREAVAGHYEDVLEYDCNPILEGEETQ